MHCVLFIKLSLSFFLLFPGSLEGQGIREGAGMFSMTTAPFSTALGKLGSGGGRSGVLGIFLLLLNCFSSPGRR